MPINSPPSTASSTDYRKHTARWKGLITYALFLFGAVPLAGCGGGGVAGEVEVPATAAALRASPLAITAPAQTPPVVTPSHAFAISGVVATGAPVANAQVMVFDKKGGSTSATTDASGNYSVTVPAGAVPPFVLEARKGDLVLVSAISKAAGTANITSLTNLMAARLAPNGNPQSLKQAIQDGTATVNKPQLDAKVQEVRTILKPLIEALGDTTNPLTGQFAADGTGHDRLLDNVRVNIRPAGSTSNIEVTVISKPVSAAAQPLSTSFSSDTLNPTPLVGTLAVSDLLPTGIEQMAADLLTRTTACYALPLQERVDNAGATATLVVGTAANIVAAACRSVFADGDPASFLNNGARVGRDANNNGAFSGIFRAGAQGAVFEDAHVGYMMANGDVVITFRTRNAAGVPGQYDSVAVRPSASQVNWIGNQYQYAGGVGAFMQDREFFRDLASNYQSTGYELFAANAQDAQGNPLFSKVIVSTPIGTTLTLAPNGGRTSMVIRNQDGSLSGTSIFRLAARFTGTRTGDPAIIDFGLVYASPRYTDQQIRGFPFTGAWIFEFFHADPTVPNVVQVFRAIERASTLAELAVLAFPVYTEAFRSEMAAKAAGTGLVFFGPVSSLSPNRAVIGTADGGDGWEVPASAWAPTTVAVFGTAPNNGPPYDDGSTVSATARRAIISCSPLGSADTHCDNSTGIAQYAQGTSWNSIQLLTRTQDAITLNKAGAFYRPLQ